MHAATAAALRDAIGFEPEARPYFPHVTVARWDRGVGAGDIEGYLRRSARAELPPALPTSFALWSSGGTGRAREYRVVDAFEFVVD